MNIFKCSPFIILLMLLLPVGCGGNFCNDYFVSVSFVKVESVHTKLINGIESYQSVDQFKDFLSHNSYQWDESKSQPATGRRPPYNTNTIIIKNYSYLGFYGELDVGFFNNRLIRTTFIPIDYEKCMEAIVKIEGLKFDSNQSAKLPPHTNVRFAVDYKGRKYISWSDDRLDREVKIWIMRYS